MRFVVAATAFSLRFVVAAAAFFATSAAAATAALVDVAMLNLFFRRSTNFLNRDVEVQMLARERVVTVNCDFVAFNFNNAHGNGTLVGVRLKLHASLKVFDALKAILGHDLFECRIGLAVTIRWIDAHFSTVASLLAYKRSFEARNDVAMTMKIDQRLPGLGLINQCAFVVF